MSNKIFIGALVVMVIAAGSAALFRKNRIDSIAPAICTQEGLVCPDGTTVGRSGSQCTFTPCPMQSSYTGKLTKQEDKYFLVVGAQAAGEVSYAMPLRSKGNLEPLVGKQVTVRGGFTEGNTYGVDQFEEVSAATSNTTVVGVGETQFVNGVRITLNKVVQDNRCPIDVQCIEAGAITANVTLKSNTDTETFNMPSDEVPHAFDSYRVSIEQVLPAAVSTRPIDPKVYRVTFRVQETAAPTAGDVQFTGRITAYSTGCFVDATCSVTVDGKVIIITKGWRADVPVGSLQGVPSIADLEHKIGAQAKVFAHKNSATEYTLYGNTGYYVKVL